MNETLTVHDFGPIRDATVTFKRVTVFIGPTGGGKSTLAKLAAIWREGDVIDEVFEPRKILGDFGLGSYQHNSTLVSWQLQSGDTMKWYGDLNQLTPVGYKSPVRETVSAILSDEDVERIAQQLLKAFLSLDPQPASVTFNDKSDREVAVEFGVMALKALRFTSSPHYLPAERVFYGSINSSLAGLMRDDIGLPKPLLDFVNALWQARKTVTDLDLPLFNAKYEHRNDEDFIRLPNREKALRLNETASGIQSVAPLLVLLEHLSRQTDRPQSFIIEEPELNLFPEAQQELLNVLVAKCARADGPNDLIITTHSPYILAACNLLLEAWKVWEKRPELAAEIAAIVPRESWINPAEFAAYHVADGGVKPITDERTHLLGGNELDAVSGQIADAFRRLLRLAKQQPAG